jgi:hypothetical protein
MEQIRYREGYKYVLDKTYSIQTAVKPDASIATPFLGLNTEGVLTIQAGYAWDGCSGPTWDDKTNMRAGLVHDSLYQLMRERELDCGWRETADNELRRICREDGMGAIRAWCYYKAVRMAGENSAKWQEEKYAVAP